MTNTTSPQPTGTTPSGLTWEREDLRDERGTYATRILINGVVCAAWVTATHTGWTVPTSAAHRHATRAARVTTQDEHDRPADWAAAVHDLLQAA